MDAHDTLSQAYDKMLHERAVNRAKAQGALIVEGSADKEAADTVIAAQTSFQKTMNGLAGEYSQIMEKFGGDLRNTEAVEELKLFTESLTEKLAVVDKPVEG